MPYTHTDVTLPAEFTDRQDWDAYTAEDHGTWNILYTRQSEIIRKRACKEYWEGSDLLGLSAERIPNYADLSATMKRKTGWQIAVVPCFIPPELFFQLLAQRHFPATAWIRSRAQIDYLPEPDMFHDVFGHMPMLVHPVFADYMQKFGEAGLHAMKQGALDEIQRLYWFTVEFGLIASPQGPRIYGSGILSSKGESIYSLEDPAPHHIRFNLERVMRTTYRIDEFQKTYFVIDSFDQLFKDCQRDFSPIYKAAETTPTIPWTEIDPADQVLQRGTVEGEPDRTHEDPAELMEKLNKTRAEREKKKS